VRDTLRSHVADVMTVEPSTVDDDIPFGVES
jgi:hypothetical protein